MPLIFRDTKGAPLTSAEGDANIRRLDAGKDIVDAVTPGPLSWTMNRLAGYIAAFYIATSGSKRWGFGATNGAESGANAGSDWFIDGYADDGSTIIGRAIAIARKTLFVTFGGSIGVGTNTTTGAGISINGAPASYKNLITSTAGLARWAFGQNNTAESSTATGSDFFVQRYDNTGAATGTPIIISRATGQTTFSTRPLFGAATAWDNSNLPNPVKGTAGGNGINLSWGGSILSLTIDTTGIGDFLVTNGSSQIKNGPLGINSAGGGASASSALSLYGQNTTCTLGFNSFANTHGAVIRMANADSIDFCNFNQSGFFNVTCQTLSQSSDSAFKTEVKSITDDDLAMLDDKRAVRYKLKSDGTYSIGFIAQEWQKDYPELAFETGTDIDEDGDFIAHQYAPAIEIMKEVPILDENGNDTGETQTVGTGEYTGGEEIFGPNGKPQSRKALGFNYGNSAALAIAGVIDLRKRVKTLEEIIADMQVQINALKK